MFPMATLCTMYILLELFYDFSLSFSHARTHTQYGNMLRRLCLSVSDLCAMDGYIGPKPTGSNTLERMLSRV